ncbi:hypothetical protein H9Q69_001894 [Fusarium xylarioides]|uniref:BTB domain-containing protein n=1 Tax=Fusarium xylarioides TaxID=221167 RepID=A0A9P7LNE8_9HYPO|nr:hypothetical protein H9Q70_001927 [Fusarium xylarioides]KAG5767870.1 hypothetical protein H9Q72_004434 [Fusarium xylarioides]KAG5786086.1 hypothetical protein H9Q73_000216 [Fusarium xylarioides]KAG5799064.1 hypothetical protein H9Q69_001894 [Fusarium xylarioides]KAG5820176.1 hypothetical protein H9Q71_000714 [Fusarium xylarioides]
MAVFTHDIAPNGDLYIVLEKANTMRTIPSVTFRFLNVDPPEFGPELRVVNLPETTSGLELPKDQDEDLKYRFRVSSHHLTLASPVFRKMLDGPWKESTPAGTSLPETTPETPAEATKASAIREISTTGWDVHAFVTVLRIMHGCNRQVPEVVSPSFFMDVAVIVDYYECADAVAIAANLWKDDILAPKSGRFPIGGKASVMWLSVAWVFAWPSEFGRAAYREVYHSQGMDLIDTHDLPVAMLLEKLEEKRKWSFEFFTARVTRLRVKLLEKSLGCNRECRLMLLGAIQEAEDEMHKQLVTSGLPYHGISISAIDDIWEHIEESPDCPESKRGHPRHCGLKKLMKPTFDEIIAEFRKIKITDFRAKKV